MGEIGLECPQSGIARSLDEARGVLERVGLPAIIRPSYTLGGTGGGIAYNRAEFAELAAAGIDASPAGEILVEESVLGWKEFEMEVVRDKADNAIIVCSIENLDPMGIHTGDSITVAPALTLTDKEYQSMRNAAIAVLRKVGVETGGSNVQFAVDPSTGRLVVIEMNPRVSRSSALASKATGFPIAKVAAKLAVGYTLDEIANDITGVTPASFEPAIDYVVTKVPRFAFEKFPGAEALLTTSMKSVGEAMAIGRSFCESLQKALRSMETGLTGLDEIDIPGAEDGDTGAVLAALGQPRPDRLLVIAEALRRGVAIDAIHRACAVDPWFLREIEGIVRAEAEVRARGLPADAAALGRLKAQGFGDRRLATLAGSDEAAVAERRAWRSASTRCSSASTPAPQSSNRARPTCIPPTRRGRALTVSGLRGRTQRAPDKIIVLGGGPNRIGQGIEFDYCCVHAAYALKEAGFETIMVNCNPETVSTDYDTSDRLYFEPLTTETVLDIVRVERRAGDLVGLNIQFGGQTPLRLAKALEAAGVPILGTAPDAIDLAEDRERFRSLLAELGLRQPDNETCTSSVDARAIAERIGYPVVVRPSYVLGGRAMEIVNDSDGLMRYMRDAAHAFGDGPILLDRYLKNAVEVDVDALADGENVAVAGILEHIEEAGIHSGDSACALPPHSLSAETVDEIRRQTVALARALDVRGLMNVQYAVQDGTVYVLEVNPRASRTVPFVAKSIGTPIAKLAALAMTGARLPEAILNGGAAPGHIAVKEAVFPFARFPGVDPVLGPEMKSTGEVMGIDRDFGSAFAKAQIGAGMHLPVSGRAFVSVRDDDKPAAVAIARSLAELGFDLVATGGTRQALAQAGIAARHVNKVQQGRPHIVDAIKDGTIQLVVNTTEGAQARLASSRLRRAALEHHVPYFTTLSGSRAMIRGVEALKGGGLDVAPLQSYSQAHRKVGRQRR